MAKTSKDRNSNGGPLPRPKSPRDLILGVHNSFLHCLQTELPALVLERFRNHEAMRDPRGLWRLLKRPWDETRFWQNLLPALSESFGRIPDSGTVRIRIGGGGRTWSLSCAGRKGAHVPIPVELFLRAEASTATNLLKAGFGGAAAAEVLNEWTLILLATGIKCVLTLTAYGNEPAPARRWFGLHRAHRTVCLDAGAGRAVPVIDAGPDGWVHAGRRVGWNEPHELVQIHGMRFEAAAHDRARTVRVLRVPRYNADREWSGLNVVKAVFKDAKFENCRFEDMTFGEESSPENALFHNCSFVRCVWEYWETGDSKFVNCTFQDCILDGILLKCEIRDCEFLNNFVALDLSHSMVVGSRFVHCNLDRSSWTGVKFDSVVFDSVDYVGAYIPVGVHGLPTPRFKRMKITNSAPLDAVLEARPWLD